MARYGLTFPSAGSKRIHQLALSASAPTTRNITDTALATFTDTVATTRQHGVADTALAFSDGVATARQHTVADTALVSFSDAVGTTRNRIVADTSLSFTDSVATVRQRAVADTGISSFSDSVVGVRVFPRGVTDSALTQPALYTDTFTRSVSAGSWGTTDSGQTWTALGTTTASFFSVNGTTGLVTPTTNTVNIVGIDAGGGFADGDIYMDMSASLLPTTGNMGVGFRTQAANPEQNYYRARIVLPAATGAPIIDLAVILANGATTLASVTAGSSIAAGDTWRMHVRATGNRLSVRAYPSGNVEPSTWDIDVIDTQWASGGFLVRQQIGSGTPKPVTSFDNLAVTRAFDSPTVTRGLLRTIADTVLSFSDSIASTRQHTVADTALSVSDTIATIRQRILADTAVSFSDSVVRVGAHARTATDTGLSFSDAVATTRTRILADTSLSFTDSLASLRTRLVADTAVSLSDTVATQRLRVVVDTAVSVADAVQKAALRHATDTALSFTDTVAATGAGHVNTTDTALSFSDTISRTAAHSRTTSDTGLSFSESVSTFRFRNTTDTGLSFSDSISRNATRSRTVTDSFSFSDSPTVAKGPLRSVTDSFGFSDTISTNSTRSRSITETFVFSDSVVATRTMTGSFLFASLLVQFI